MKLKIRVPHFISLIKDAKQFFAERKTQMLAASLSCAFVLSFSFVALSRFEVGGNSLMASVANLQNPTQTVSFDADIALVQKNNSLVLVAGKLMEKVDFLEGVIALNPSLGVQISTNESNVFFAEESAGMYRFRIDFSGKNISAGLNLANFEKNSDLNIPLTFIDTQFVSSGERYNLSNIVE